MTVVTSVPRATVKHEVIKLDSDFPTLNTAEDCPTSTKVYKSRPGFYSLFQGTRKLQVSSHTTKNLI